jgi:carbon-monoxide dehydrogenase small subunit
MPDIDITVTVNRQHHEARVEPRLLLVHFLRDRIGLTGTHVGCDTSSCGACTVLIDGVSVKSCTMFAAQADGSSVTTIEGIGNAAELHPLQEAFWTHHGLQCGYCTTGMIMSAADLLARHPDPTDDQIREGLEGNLCRCTGYHNIVKSVRAAGRAIREKHPRRSVDDIDPLTPPLEDVPVSGEGIILHPMGIG